MFRRFTLPILFVLIFFSFNATGTLAQNGKELPREWIDPDTGHRIIRLSDEAGSQSLYFHQNGYSPDGQKLIITTPTGLSTVDLKTRKVEKVIEGRVSVLIVGRKTGQVYYTKFVRDNGKFSATVYATDLNTKATREIVKLPPGASVSTVNADETLLAGTIDELTAKAIAESKAPATPRPNAPSGDPAPDAPPSPRADAYPGKGAMMERR